MFFLALLLVSGDFFAGGGVNHGPSLTNTQKNYSAVLELQAFPFPYRKVGFFYDFQFRNRKFPVSEPFSIKEKERSHSFGPVFRLSTGRIQPWLGVGIMVYSADTEIKLLDKFLIGEGQKRSVPFTAAGIRTRVWKKLYEEIEVSLADTARPPLQFSARIVWRF